MQPVKIKRADPAMPAKEILPSEIPPEDKDICLQFLAFPDSFAIDWFAGVPQVSPSRLISALAFLERRQWIISRPGEKGIYEWTKKLPREEIIGGLPPAEMAGYYRCAANLLQQQVPVTKETLLKAAQLSLLAGMREQDLDAVFQAALMEEENHKISSAIHLYECLLKFVSDLAQENRGQLSRQTIAILIKAVERRASLSLFHPNLKQINHFLSMAIKQADEIEDALAQASLHLSDRPELLDGLPARAGRGAFRYGVAHDRKGREERPLSPRPATAGPVLMDPRRFARGRAGL